MPHPSLSLFGFLGFDEAAHYLTQTCDIGEVSPDTIKALWENASYAIGSVHGNPGHPEVLDVPSPLAPYVEAVNCGWPGLLTQPGFSLKMVEVRPLLAYQLSITLAASENHCSKFAKPPTDSELFAVCMPQHPPQERLVLQATPNSLIVRAKSLNVRVLQGGYEHQTGFAGVKIGPALPFTHVVLFGGRYYLHNGYHRAYGAALAGATHIPCLLREATSAEDAGIRTDGTTFRLELLESNNPPTVGHFLDGRAQPVAVRNVDRVIHVSWSEYTLLNE